MANETTTTTLTETIQALIKEAQVTTSPGVWLADYIANEDLPIGNGSMTFPRFDEEVMASIAEGTDGANTAFDTTAVSITPGENLLMTTLTDLADRRSAMNAGAKIGGVMKTAYKKLQNFDIYALCDGFSTALGTTNVDITLALIRQGVATVRNGGAEGMLYMPVTPWVMEDLLGLYTPSTSVTSDSLRQQANVEGVLPMIEGVVPILVDLPQGTGTGQASQADTKTGIFSADALGIVREWDFKIETERDASIRGTELIATCSYGVGELNDAHGVELLVDNKD